MFLKESFAEIQQVQTDPEPLTPDKCHHRGLNFSSRLRDQSAESMMVRHMGGWLSLFYQTEAFGFIIPNNQTTFEILGLAARMCEWMWNTQVRKGDSNVMISAGRLEMWCLIIKIHKRSPGGGWGCFLSPLGFFIHVQIIPRWDPEKTFNYILISTM